MSWFSANSCTGRQPKAACRRLARGLSCRRSEGRHHRHAAVNSTIKIAFETAKIPARLEPVSLSRSDGKRPDGATVMPWSHGQLLVWDAMNCSCTFYTCLRTFYTCSTLYIFFFLENFFMSKSKYKDSNVQVSVNMSPFHKCPWCSVETHIRQTRSSMRMMPVRTKSNIETNYNLDYKFLVPVVIIINYTTLINKRQCCTRTDLIKYCNTITSKSTVMLF